MPELPEVETIRRGLHKVLIGKTITKVRIRETRLRYPIRPRVLRRWLLDQRIVAIDRRAKYLLCRMENDGRLVIHLGMSGRVLWCDAGLPLDKHDHVQFVLDDGNELRFRDPRKFGLVDAIAPGKLSAYPHFKHLGVEPLSTDFSPDHFHARTRGLSRPIKNYLMDATKMVGIGNIYANEALFRAGIHPATPTGKLGPQRWRRLIHSIQDTLNLAIDCGGTTISDFYDSNGDMGYFQLHTKVYAREGEPCDVCAAKIRRFVQTGRSSYYCPRCQRMR